MVARMWLRIAGVVVWLVCALVAAYTALSPTYVSVLGACPTLIQEMQTDESTLPSVCVATAERAFARCMVLGVVAWGALLGCLITASVLARRERRFS